MLEVRRNSLPSLLNIEANLEAVKDATYSFLRRLSLGDLILGPEVCFPLVRKRLRSCALTLYSIYNRLL